MSVINFVPFSINPFGSFSFFPFQGRRVGPGGWLGGRLHYFPIWLFMLFGDNVVSIWKEMMK